MTTPTPGLPVPLEPDADDFLVTREIGEDGQLTSRRIKLQDLPPELLFYFGSNGNDRAMSELASRLIKDAAEQAT